MLATTVAAALGLGCLQAAEGQEAPAPADVQTVPPEVSRNRHRRLRRRPHHLPRNSAGVPAPISETPAPPAEAVPQAPESVAPPAESATEATPSVPAASATPKVAQDDSKSSIEEVVVTARRVKESQQTVPVAITAFNADTLKREQINSAQDLTGRVPSLVISSNGQTRNTETRPCAARAPPTGPVRAW